MREIPKFDGLSCFEICHHEDCKDLFANICRGNSMYSSSLRNNPAKTFITEVYKDDLPRRSQRTTKGRPTKVAQNRPNRITNLDEATPDTDSEESQLSNPRVRKRKSQRMTLKRPARRTAASNVCV